MKRYIPNFLTSLNLFTGGLGCIMILTQSPPETAIYFIALCGLFDFLDGFAARLLKVQSSIGKELDSLADMVSFGLLPAIVMYKLLLHAGPNLEWIPFLSLLIAVFSGYRLAMFNVDDRQTDQFIGLPTPANAIMIASLPFLHESISLSVTGLLIITVVSSYLLVSPLKIIALKFKGTSWKSNMYKYLVLIISVIILALFQQQGLPFVIPAYLLISIAGNFTTKNGV